MSIETVVKCDVCGAVRGPANHWFWTIRAEDFFTVYTWGNGPVERTPTNHLCGQKCVHALLDQFMTP